MSGSRAQSGRAPPPRTPREHGPLVEVFAQNVRALRLGEGLTQRELGKALGVSEDYLRKLERGARGATLDLVAAVAEVFDVAPAYLLQENDCPRRSMARGRRARLTRKVQRQWSPAPRRSSRARGSTSSPRGAYEFVRREPWPDGRGLLTVWAWPRKSSIVSN